jgi:hypothetical protein
MTASDMPPKRHLPRWVSLLTALAVPSMALAQASVAVERLPDNRVKLSWEDTAGSLALESSPALATGAIWLPVTGAPVVQGSLRTLEVPVADEARFYRLTGDLGFFGILSTSPTAGETGISVNRETVFDLSTPLANTATINGRVTASAAGRTILTRTDLSEDRRRVTLFYLENLPQGARVRAVFNGTGLVDQNGRQADFDGDKQSGGEAVVIFETVNTSSLANTAVTGRVLASEPGPGGADLPLQGVTVTVDGREETLRAVTDANGFFRLQPAPSGRFFVNVDGRTAALSQWPNGAYYPIIGKGWEAVAGKTNNLAGGTGIVYLPLVAPQTLGPVSATEETTVTFPDSVLTAMPELTGVEIAVPANGLFADNGTRGGRVGLAPVASSRLPEPLPAGLTHALDISIQTDGPQNFDRPVPAKFPNLPDPVTGEKLPPGAKTALWSFNHDTGRWEIQGSMTITPDGLFAVSDPGVGIRQPGWHGTSPGGSGNGGPGGPGPGPCPDGGNGGGILEEGTSGGGGGKCGCPDEPSEAKQKEQECFSNAANCAMKCYEKCGSGGFINKFKKAFKLGYECAKAARCSIKCKEDGERCKDHWQDCVLHAGGSLRRLRAMRAAQADFGDNPAIIEALKILDEIEAVSPLWDALAAVMDRAPSFDELSPSDQALFDSIIAQLETYYGNETIEQWNTRHLTRLTQLLLNSPFADSALPPVQGYYVIEDLDTGLVRRNRTEPRGFINGLVLRPDTLYRIRLLLGPTLTYHEAEFTSGGAGQTTRLPFGEPVTPPAVDVDGDKIPAAAEFVLGTSDTKADSDADGVNDLDELRNRTNPLDGQPPVTGIVATLDTPGNATDVSIQQNVALIADGAAGVALVDLTDPLRPALLQQVDTPGNAQAVGLSGSRAAIADGDSGLMILNVANPGSPSMVGQLALGGDARAVVAGDSVAYVGLATGLVSSIDLLAAVELSRVTLPGNPKIEDLAQRDGFLYVWAAGRLHVLSDAAGIIEWLTSVDASAGGGQGSRRMRLSVSADRIYAAYPSGVVVFDLTNPAAPTLLQKRNTTQNGWKQLSPVLPGLAIAADGLNLVNDEPQDVSLYDLGDDGTELNFLAGFVTPGVSHALVLDRGLAFLADGAAGLQVINFTPADTAGIPPTVELLTSFPLNPPQIESGQPGRVTALANDDVAVREVEFYLDGALAAVDRAWPFEFRFVAMERTATKTDFTLRVRAVDTAGNATDTPLLTVQLLPDTTPPRVLAVAPGDNTVPEAVTTVLARFNEPLDFASVAPGSVELLSAGPDLIFGNADDQPLDGAVGYFAASFSAAIEFTEPLPIGRYRFTVANVRDLAGNPLATPLVSHFYVAPGGPDGDPDGDGLTNSEESLANTSPFTEDTDKDGWVDEVEYHDGKDARDPGSRPQTLVYGKPPVSALIEDAAEVLPAVPGPVVARPGVEVFVEPAEELAAAGPFMARPPVQIIRELDDELAPAGPWLGRPPVTLLRTADSEEAPAGPWLGRPPVSARILTP